MEEVGRYMRRKRRKSYKFTEKTHSKQAMLSAVLAGVSFIMYLVFIYLSYHGGGKLSAYYGGFGFLAMIMSIVALFVALPTLKEEDSFTLFPRWALCASILSTVCWVGTYILGFMRG